jgi:hypothetical protein
MTRKCFYHKYCSDGLAAAWCVKMKYSDCEIIGVTPQQNSLDEALYKKQKVIFVDVCPSEKVLKNVYSKAKSITILDHHKTYEKMVKQVNKKHEEKEKKKYGDKVDKKRKKIDLVFDLNRAGCQIAWDHYNKKSKSRPWFLDYIADRDMWKFNLKNSKLINMALYDKRLINFISFDRMYNMSEKDTKKLIDEELLPYASIIESRNQHNLQQAARFSLKAEMNINGKKYNCWLGAIEGSLKSEFGNMLCAKKFKNGELPDFAAIWRYDPKSGEWWIALRSDSKRTEVDKICEAVDEKGGGHAAAAGFTIYPNSHLKDYFVVVDDI